jgi:hypothetical protein
MRLPGSAVRVVEAPDGTEWKIYVARFQLPRWRPADYEASPGSVARTEGGVFIIVDAALSLVYDLVVPLLRALVTAPFVLIGSSRSTRRRIEALTLWPHEERYVWETEAADVEPVVEQIAAGLGRGRFAQPAEAIFLGREP